MSGALGERDMALLRMLQEGIPLEPRPYLAIASKLGWEESDVLERIAALTDNGTLRKVGAVISPRGIGYASSLMAVDVPEEEVEEAASIINAYPGVTHNYLREGSPNVWFTMTERDMETIEEHVKEIENALGTGVRMLPATRVYKIGVRLDI